MNTLSRWCGEPKADAGIRLPFRIEPDLGQVPKNSANWCWFIWSPGKAGLPTFSMST